MPHMGKSVERIGAELGATLEDAGYLEDDDDPDPDNDGHNVIAIDVPLIHDPSVEDWQKIVADMFDVPTRLVRCA